MTETTARIRWHDEPSNSMAACAGSIGTLDPDMFHIWRPDAHCAEWQLTTRLHGMEQKHCYGDTPDELKAEAERWLEQFASSLGASFPEDADRKREDTLRKFAPPAPWLSAEPVPHEPEEETGQ